MILSRDQELYPSFDPDFGDVRVSVVPTMSALKDTLASGNVQGIVIDGGHCSLSELAALGDSVDLAQTIVIAGSRVGTSKLLHVAQSMLKPAEKQIRHRELTLTDYVQTKFEDFVRAMKEGSARDIYPMLMQAVERPLIELALRETNGNQMQAARLLGMNRNTLKKKIVEFRIPVARLRDRRRDRST